MVLIKSTRSAKLVELLLRILFAVRSIVRQDMLQGGITMSLISRFKWLTRTLVAVTFALLFTLATTISALASVTLLQVSSDPFTNSDSQHATEVEPDTFAFGNTIVSAFQVGRFFSGGASDIGFATSTNGGHSFTSVSLPGATSFATPADDYAPVSPPSAPFASTPCPRPPSSPH